MANKIASCSVVFFLCTTLTYAATTFFCSTQCGKSGCTGWTSADCDNNCNTAYSWVSQPDKSCALNSTSNKDLIDLSDDVGGGITVSPISSTPDCTGFPSITIPTYGSYKANSVVTITEPGGTSLPHWGLDLFYGMIQIDADGSDSWNNAKIFTNLNGASPAQNPSYSLNGTNKLASFKTYCGSNNKWENYFQVTNTYTHNATNVDISFDIKTDNNKPNALYVIKEVVLVAKLCNIACLSCYSGGTNTTCTSCDGSVPYLLNNNTCYNICTTGFGYTDDPALCVWCNIYCTSCYAVADNCSSCYTNGSNSSFLYVNDTAGYSNCVKTCPAGYFGNTTTYTCDLCDPSCTTCKNTATYCFSCLTGYGWNNYACYQPCDIGFYYTNNNNNCTQCPSLCSECINASVCTVCNTNGSNIGYLQGLTCVNPCGAGTYGFTNYGSGPNTCSACNSMCTTCTDSPSPCQSCASEFYLYNSTCGSTCPDGLVALASINQCINCSTSCIDLKISIYAPSAIVDKVYVDMTFSQALNLTSFDYVNFQSISISNNQMASFNLSYQILSSNSYRIIVEPIGFVFLYNQTVTVTTTALPSTLQLGLSGTPFMPSNYGKSAQMSWFLMKPPDMTDTQKQIVNQMSSINSLLAKVTTTPFVAEVKKSGVLTMVFSGALMTTTSIFVNSVPAQNLYEGARFWGIFVMYDVPAWEQNSNIPNYALGAEIHSITQNQRRLFDLTTIYWRFQRTGQSSFFIYDVYIPILLIVVCWVCVLVAYLLRNKFSFKAFQPKFFTVMHKVHQISIFYVTMAMIMEWLYFDAASLQRWISLIVCIIFSTYFVSYELYIYYDMIKYPEAMIGNQKYQYYMAKYSFFLKNIRYVQFDAKEQWSPKHWFRPYNFHVLSYYRKFCIIICLPIFYQNNHVQAVFMILIQLMEIGRLLATQPFSARWRNIFRLVLELMLLGFFVILLVNSFLIDVITQGSPSSIMSTVETLYRLGWVGFALVFAFNIGYLVLFFIDLVVGFRYTNRELMDEARRIYYYDKINQYQKQNEQVPLSLMNRWVKMGNLNMRNMEALPDINLRIEYYRLVRKNQYFDVQIQKVVELFMNTDLNFHKQNNTTVGKKINKKTKLSKQLSSSLYGIMCGIFDKYAKKDTESIAIKTFTRVSQNKFSAGDKIPLLPEAMFQKLEIQNTRAQKSSIKLPQMIKGFPLNAYELQSI